MSYCELVKLREVPEMITPAFLEVVVMDNGEVIHAGKTIGWAKDFVSDKYLHVVTKTVKETEASARAWSESLQTYSCESCLAIVAGSFTDFSDGSREQAPPKYCANCGSRFTKERNG